MNDQEVAVGGSEVSMEERIERILRGIFLGAVFATTLVPCVVSGLFVFPYMSAKGHLFRLLVEIAVAAWAVLAVARPSLRPRWSPLLVSALVFVAIIGLADALGVCPARSLLGNLERMEGWLTHLHLLALFVVLPSALSSEKLWRRFFIVSVAASVVVTCVAFGQFAGLVPLHSPNGRINGTLGNPSFFAAYLAFHIWLVCFLLRGSLTDRARFIGRLVVLFQSMALFLSGTRSVALGLVVGGLVAAGLASNAVRERPYFRRLAVLMLVAALLVAVGFVVLLNNPTMASGPLLGRFAAISASELTAHGRLLAWGVALEGAAERPWLGWGQESFSIVYARHYDPRLFTHDPFFDRAHNVFLQWLVAGGVAALFAYCALLATFLWMVWRSGAFNIVERSLLTGLVVGYVVHSSLLFDTLTSLMFGVIMCAFVHWRSTADRAPVEESGRIVFSVVAAALVVLAVLAAGLTLWTMAAERALVAAIRPDPRGLPANLESFRRALRHRTPATPKVRERLLMTAIDIGRSNPQDREALSQLTSLGVEEMGRQIESWPLDVRSQVALGSFLWRFGAFEDAEGILRHAHALAPRMQHILFELGAVQLAHGEPGLAVETLQTAYGLSPGWTLARHRYAAAAIAAGQRALVEELMIEQDGTIAVGDEWIINALRATGDLPNLVKALQDRMGAVLLRGEDISGLQRQLEEARNALKAEGEGGS